jgi:CRP/FNR family transcriptional regulator, anaerobic regulatory protein
VRRAAPAVEVARLEGLLSAATLEAWFAGNPPPADQIAEFLAAFRPRELAARTVVVRAGASPAEFGVIDRGLLRLFYLRRDGRELNKSFLTTGDFVGALDALISGAPTRIWIETIEPTTLRVASHRALTDMYLRHPGWERLGRRFAEAMYLKKIAREASLLMDTAAERYQTFLDEHAAIENRIPDYHIAAYLGISAEALSRLKRARLRAAPRARRAARAS